MGPFWKFVRRDAKNVFANAISIVVVAGLAVLPSLYAWFNIAGSWDPYGNTANLKVAVASVDEGYTDEYLPLTINIGDSVVAELRESTKIGYVFVSEDQALEGVRSGEYYAAVVIPKDFSRDMMSALSDDRVHPQLLFYSNEKENAIASIVTGKASTSVQQLINESFTEAVVSVGANVLDELVRSLDDDDMVALAQAAQASLEDGSQQLWDVSTHLHGYVRLVGSLQDLVDSSSAAATDSGGSGYALARALSDSATGVRSASSGISTATGSLSSALATATSSFDDVDDAIDEIFDGADTQASEVSAAMGRAKERVDARLDAVRQVQAALSEAQGELDQLEADLEAQEPTTEAGRLALEADLRAVDAARRALDDVSGRVDTAESRLGELSDALRTGMDDVSALLSDAHASRDDLERLAAQAKASVADVQGSFDGSLATTLGGLADSIDDASTKAAGVSQQVDDTLDDLGDILDDSSDALGDVARTLEDSSDQIDDAVTQMDELLRRLRAGLESGNVDTIRTIIGGDPEGLAQFVAAPVEMDREAVFPIANNGSAMAPYYSAMAIWVGGTLMGCLVSVKPSRRALEETGAKPRHAYFGRLVFFLALSLAQSTLIMLGDIFYLGIQCVHPVLYVLVGWACSFAFINIIYSLTYSFGDVGKAIAVFLMVMQVAGSGGTFPMEMLPEAFRRIYPFLPFVHAENAMRAAICGIYGNDYLVSMAKLLAFIAPALLLGLVLRKPVIRLNEWMERKMHATHLMLG